MTGYDGTVWDYLVLAPHQFTECLLTIKGFVLVLPLDVVNILSRCHCLVENYFLVIPGPSQYTTIGCLDVI